MKAKRFAKHCVEAGLFFLSGNLAYLSFNGQLHWISRMILFLGAVFIHMYALCM